MTDVRLLLPSEVLADLELSDEGGRDASVLTIAIDGINVAAGLVALAALRPQLAALASALRRWVLRRSEARPIRLTVRGRGVNMTIDLPPNVGTGEILDALEDLFD